MDSDLGQEIVRNSIGLLFGLVQAGTIGLFCGAFKLWFDVKTMRKDLNQAFKKIREIEDTLYFEEMS